MRPGGTRPRFAARRRHGVKFLTLYAFSTENWGRPSAEVDALMELFSARASSTKPPELIRQGVRVRMIGERSRFSEKVQKALAEIEQRTAEGKTITLILALKLLLAQRNNPRRAPNRRKKSPPVRSPPTRFRRQPSRKTSTRLPIPTPT